MTHHHLFARALAILGALGLSLAPAIALPAQGGPAPLPATNAARLALLRQKIRYVFVIYQENRSFDSYFGTFPGADGFYSGLPREIPGFSQPLVNTDGTTSQISPFRIGPAEYAADTDDVDHSHARTIAKMDIVDGVPRMDRFALTEELKYTPSGNPTLQAKQFGELAMAYEDCDTVPFLWQYAKRFALYDHIFESISGPSTPGNLVIIAGQAGITQWLQHPEEGFTADGNTGPGVPVVNDADPFWGSPSDHSANPMPVNPKDFPGYETQYNLTFAGLPITLAGRSITSVAGADTNAAGDLRDIGDDITMLGRSGVASSVPWGWYEEGYTTEPSDDAAGPTDAMGRHASYITHHNGPQYFGYVANNSHMRARLHGLDDFFVALQKKSLPREGGVFYVKGGYRNIMGMHPANPDPAVQKSFLGDDDHPAYSDAQISEAMVAKIVNLIARSPYWKQSAIIITWDDSEGDYDHVRPPIQYALPGEAWVSEGPRVPLILISPYARRGGIVHEFGDQSSVVKLVDDVFGLTPLSSLPDEARARALGLARYGLDTLGPEDDPGNAITDLLTGFDDGRLSGRTPALPASDAVIPDDTVNALPQNTGFGCKALGIVPTDDQMGLHNPIPADFNPRPKTNPTKNP
ncbi:MAG TPA: alkaline phosphatase family protein [Candidatus Eremiobacteraceae bacterium]|nr:alkaline phosphatase family protein [Candidatus Eremiobacteraceae bacterium]